MKKYTVLAVLFLLLGLGTAFAQGNMDEALASEFYRNGEYDKAALLYKKLLDREPNSTVYYDSYLSCLLNLKEYETAEKELKKLIKRSDRPWYYQVDLGYIYALQGDDKKSKKEFDDILEGLPANDNRIQATAAALNRRGQKDYAIEAFKKGRRLMNDNLAYAAELAELYKEKKDYQSMFTEYMRILDANPYQFENVRDRLQETVMQDEPYEMLKKVLLKKVQAEPDNVAYSELLSWVFLQRKDFNAAFIQTRAIDRRLKEGGRRLVGLAGVVAANKEYDLAENIYQSVLDQGSTAIYYVAAKRGLLDIRYEKITQSASYTQEDINKLIADYQAFLQTYSMLRPESGEVVLRESEILAQYADRVDDAIALLKKYIEMDRVDRGLQARAKLALGDYLLLNGDVWSGSLYYSQVEKSFKDNPLGHEAKFRNAKLYFYQGDFEWAKAMLDVLKSSTSELIANDAMQLSLLIQDNIGLDTTEKPLKMFAEADLYIFKNMLPQAEAKLDSINAIYPRHTLDDEILMARAAIAVKRRDYTKAMGFYEKVYTDHSKDLLADDAIYKAALIQDNIFKDKEKAKTLYEKLILEYRSSVYVVDARNRFRTLRGDVIK